MEFKFNNEIIISSSISIIATNYYTIEAFTIMYLKQTLCSSPNIVRVIKSRRMRWAGHVARMGEEREGV